MMRRAKNGCKSQHISRHMQLRLLPSALNLLPGAADCKCVNDNFHFLFILLQSWWTFPRWDVLDGTKVLSA